MAILHTPLLLWQSKLLCSCHFTVVHDICMAHGSGHLHSRGGDIWDRIEGSCKIGQTRNAWYLLLRAFNSRCWSLVTGALRLRLGTKLRLHPNLKCFQYCSTSCHLATCEATPIPNLLSFVWLAANWTCTKILWSGLSENFLFALYIFSDHSYFCKKSSFGSKKLVLSKNFQ